MPFFRKKPVTIEAFLLEKPNEPIPDWFNNSIVTNEGRGIKTLEGDMLARWGDWVIKGVNNEIYPCKPDIFEKTYELVND